ncbi:MAG: hypothetical protein AAB534_01060 [Patescibacteria group bacterium]
MDFISNLFNSVLAPAFNLFLFLLTFALPIILAIIFFKIWQHYIRTDYINQQEFILLEIKISKDITKTPLAMEVFLTSIWQSGAVTYTDTYWIGKTRPWFSLELVSIGGNVRFFIWAQEKFRGLIETQIYAQYPTVEIYEAEDYVKDVQYDPSKFTVWGTYWKLDEKDVYPIKTYIDYGLDKSAGEDEEFKVDPFTAVTEYLGSLKAGEQVWIQILIQVHKKEGLREGRLFKEENWKNEAKEEIEKIRKEATPEIEGSDFPGFPNPTKGQVEKISAIERSLGKYPFDTMIRGFYIAKNESFNAANIPALIGSIRQYNSLSLNKFGLGWYTDHSDNTKDWINIFSWVPGVKNYMAKLRTSYEKHMLEAYKMRSFFRPPYHDYNAEPFILTTEELATIYHFPGQVATTPTLTRIEAKKAKPPSNLPI